MNWPIFKQNLRYHYKKYLAILFASLAWVCLIGSMVMEILAAYGGGGMLADFNWVWNLVFSAIVYGTILVGNLRGTSLAFYGILLFVFSTVINAAINLFLGGTNVFLSLLAGDPVGAAFAVLSLLFVAASIVTGVFVYIRCRGFLNNTYASYAGLRNWTIAFCLLSALSALTLPALTVFISGWDLSVVTSYFAELGDVFIAAAIFFTVSRLKSEY